MSSMFKKKTGPSLKPKLVPRGRQAPAAAPTPSPAPSTTAPSPTPRPAKPVDAPRSQTSPPQTAAPPPSPKLSRPSGPQQQSRPSNDQPTSAGSVVRAGLTGPQQQVAPKPPAQQTITPPQTQASASSSDTTVPTLSNAPKDTPAVPVQPSQAVPEKQPTPRLPVSSNIATISPTPPSSASAGPPADNVPQQTAPTLLVPASVSAASSSTTPTPTPAASAQTTSTPAPQPAAQLPTPSEPLPTTEPAAIPTPTPTPAKRGRKRKALPENASHDPQPSDVTPTTETGTPQPPAKKSRQRKPRAQPQTTEDGDPSAAPKPKPKRKRKKPQTEDGEEGDQSPRRASRARSTTPSDAEEQMVDLQKLKMSDLTKDLRIGKKFSRHDELRERERRDRARSSNPASAKASQSPAPNGGAQASPGTTPAAPGSSTSTGPMAPPPRVMGGMQFQLVNGQIVVDQASLVMDRHARDAADGPLEEVEENEFTHKVTSNSYRNANSSKLKGPNHWSADDTEKFYVALRKYGTDFELISHLFPGRTRRHVKMKFNREERNHRERVDAALVGPKRVMMDFSEFVQETGKEYEETAEVQAQLKSLEEAQEEARRRVEEEDAEVNRKKLEAIHGGAGKGKKDGTAKASLK